MSDLTPSQEIGQLLRKWRESAHLSQTAVADKVGLRPPSISLHESGDRLPEPEKLADYVEIYGKSEADLNHLLRLLITARRARATMRAIAGSYDDLADDATAERAA